MRGDLVSWIMVRASDKFGGTDDGMFNAAGFSAAWKEVTGLSRTLDGRAVDALLHGRADVVLLKGGAHYRQVRP